MMPCREAYAMPWSTCHAVEYLPCREAYAMPWSTCCAAKHMRKNGARMAVRKRAEHDFEKAGIGGADGSDG
ncbi:MAG: hypothetical protein NC254_13530 [bacterium]|nr:hypothetical protein [bacterium]